MANTSSHDQPSHEAQVKGGQHSHQGSSSQSANSGASSSSNTGNRNPPSHEASVKGGQHSHQGDSNR